MEKSEEHRGLHCCSEGPLLSVTGQNTLLRRVPTLDKGLAEHVIILVVIVLGTLSLSPEMNHLQRMTQKTLKRFINAQTPAILKLT